MTNAKKRNATNTRNGNSRWSVYYDRRLRELYAQSDLTVADIAEMLGRPKTAIYQRARILGVRRYSAQTKPKRAVSKETPPAVKKRRSWLGWLLGA